MIETKQLNKLSAKELHAEGGNLREKDNHTGALQVLTAAIAKYQKEQNYEGMVDALKDRVLTWKHLALIDNDASLKILAKMDAEAMLAITQEYDLKDKYHTSYFRLGEISMIEGNYRHAVGWYRKSLKTYVGPLAEKGDYRYHLGEALYKDGKKKEGKDEMLKGLNEIQEGASEVDPFLIHVWESGAHMRLADTLSVDEPQEAKKHLEKAREIAESDKKLVIRRRQIKDLEEELNL